jgi:hypothetical protein
MRLDSSIYIYIGPFVPTLAKVAPKSSGAVNPTENGGDIPGGLFLRYGR